MTITGSQPVQSHDAVSAAIGSQQSSQGHALAQAALSPNGHMQSALDQHDEQVVLDLARHIALPGHEEWPTTSGLEFSGPGTLFQPAQPLDMTSELQAGYADQSAYLVHGVSGDTVM